MAEEPKHREWCDFDGAEDGEWCDCWLHLREIEPIKDEEIDDLLDLAMHFEDGGHCVEDGRKWPCGHARLGGRLWADRAEIARLRAALEAARIEHDADCSVHATPPGVQCGRCGYVDCGQEFGVCDCGAAEHNAAIDAALGGTDAD